MKNEANMRWKKRKKYETLLEDHPAVHACIGHIRGDWQEIVFGQQLIQERGWKT